MRLLQRSVEPLHDSHQAVERSGQQLGSLHGQSDIELVLVQDRRRLRRHHARCENGKFEIGQVADAVRRRPPMLAQSERRSCNVPGLLLGFFVFDLCRSRGNCLLFTFFFFPLRAV